MFFNSSKKVKSKAAFPGTDQLTDGMSALYTLLENGQTRIFRNEEFSAAIGFAFTGKRSAAVIDSNKWSMLDGLRSYSDKNFAFVTFVEQENPVSGNYVTLAGQNYFALYPRNSQELVDFAIIAQRISEESLIPGLCIFDKVFCADAVENLLLPEQKLIEKFIGKDADLIASTTPSQKILFGDKRRRVPKMLDTVRPVGIGVQHDADMAFKAEATRDIFYKKHINEIIKNTFEEFYSLTGRSYSSINYYKTDDAEYLILANGPVLNTLISFADFARDQLSIKLGILGIPLLQPFNGAELSHIIKRKAGLTVLQSISGAINGAQPGDLVKNSIYKSWENSRSRSDILIHPGYAVFSKPKDEPESFTAVYSGSILSVEELTAVLKNMMPDGSRQHLYYTTLDYRINQSRFPKLETLQQKLHKDYPEINQLTLPKKPITRSKPVSGKSRKISISATVVQDIADVRIPLARALQNSGYKTVKARIEKFDSGLLPLHNLTINFSLNADETIDQFKNSDLLLISDIQFIAGLNHLTDQGALVVNSHHRAHDIWQKFSEETRQIIRGKKLKLFYLDAHEIAREISPIPSNIEHLKVQALLGSIYKTDSLLSTEKFPVQLNTLKKAFQETGLIDSQVNAIINAVKGGYNNLKEIEWTAYPEFTGLKEPEAETPWTVRNVDQPDGTMFDLGRTWDSVGYLFRTGAQAQAISDPFLASNTIPARSSAFRDLSYLKEQLPHIIPERCTGCGMCWSRCPDSALPVHIFSTGDLIKAALDACAANGNKLIQIQRIADNLSKQAYKLFSQDEINRYTDSSSLLKEAFNQLTQRMGLNEDQTAKMQSEFDLVLAEVNTLPLIRTTNYFDNPHKVQSGDGQILTISVNAAACKGCGACETVCPDNAIEMLNSHFDIINNYRKNFQYFSNLPPVPQEKINRFISSENLQSQANHLLNKRNYFSLPGGDNAYPGSGVKTAVHLMTSAIESTMNIRYDLFIKKIDDLIFKLEDKVQGRLQSSVRINEFEEFSRKLSKLEGADFTASALFEVLGEQESEKKINTQHLKHLTGIIQKLITFKKEYLNAANGHGRARMAMVVDSERLLTWGSVYPYNPFAHPWINAQGRDLAATVNGVFDGLCEAAGEIFKTVRIAELELNNAYTARDHDEFFTLFSRKDFSEEERHLCPPVVLLLDQNALQQQTQQSVSALLTEDKPVYIAVINNLVDETGNAANEMALHAISLQDCYVLQSSGVNPGHLLSGIQQLVESNKPGFIHLYACEPRLQGMAMNEAYKHEIRALNGRIFPLFSYNPAKSEYFSERFDLSGNPDFEETFISANKENAVPTFADWAIHEKYYRYDFQSIAKRKWHEKMIPLHEYLLISGTEQKGLEPFINIKDGNDSEHRIGMSSRIIDASVKHLHGWLLLQELAGIRLHDREYQQKKWQVELETQLAAQKSNLEEKYNAELAHVQHEHWQIYHSRLKEKLTKIYESGNDKKTLGKTLAEFAKQSK